MSDRKTTASGLREAFHVSLKKTKSENAWHLTNARGTVEKCVQEVADAEYALIKTKAALQLAEEEERKAKSLLYYGAVAACGAKWNSHDVYETFAERKFTKELVLASRESIEKGTVRRVLLMCVNRDRNISRRDTYGDVVNDDEYLKKINTHYFEKLGYRVFYQQASADREFDGSRRKNGHWQYAFSFTEVILEPIGLDEEE